MRQSHRFWQVLVRVDTVMKAHRARFRGKTSPVHFFWGSFDLANTRFSGRPASPRAPARSCATRTTRSRSAPASGPAIPARRIPPSSRTRTRGRPVSRDVQVRPSAAGWVEDSGLFVLPYDAVRQAPDPAEALTEFLTSTYEGCANLMGWSEDLVGAEPVVVRRSRA